MTTGSPLYEILEKLPHPESDFGWIAWMSYGHMAVSRTSLRVQYRNQHEASLGSSENSADEISTVFKVEARPQFTNKRVGEG